MMEIIVAQTEHTTKSQNIVKGTIKKQLENQTDPQTEHTTRPQKLVKNDIIR